MIFLNKFATKTFCNGKKFYMDSFWSRLIVTVLLSSRYGLQGSRRDQAGQAAPLLGRRGRQAEGAESLQGLVPPHSLHVQGLLSPEEC